MRPASRHSRGNLDRNAVIIDCNGVISDARAERSALGYSGTNSGGHLIIENSVFDHNKSGLTANSQNNDDAPSPQGGACPGGGTGPLGNGSCTIWRNNKIYDNNNPDVPRNATNGLAGASPIGSGIVHHPGTHLAPPHQVYNADCFTQNTDPAGLTNDPPAVQSDPLLACGKPRPGNPGPALVVQAECAAQLFAMCPPVPGLHYPRPKAHFPLPMPTAQPTMPDPCAGVPANPWCPARR